LSKLGKLGPAALLVAAVFVVSLAFVVAPQSANATAGEFWLTLLEVFGLLLLAGGLAGLAVRGRAIRIMAVLRRRLDRLYEQGRGTHRLVSGRTRTTGAAPAASSSGSDADAVLSRVEAAERRLVSAVDTARLTYGDRLTELESRVAVLSSSVTDGMESQTGTIQDTMRRHARDTSVDVVRQVEALLQLLPRVDTSGPRFPMSGGWAMDAEGLLALSDLIDAHRPQKVLEIGSGASTSWMGTFVQRHGGSIVSLEHQRVYAEKTARAAAALGLQDTVDVRLAELKPVTLGEREYLWYDQDVLRDLQDIDMLVVDGPPKATGEDARFPALPLLVERLAPQCVVVIDDFQRPAERAMVERWIEQFPGFGLVELDTPRVGLLRRESA
jgi:predicted O-methyltransferase YrrM